MSGFPTGHGQVWEYKGRPGYQAHRKKSQVCWRC